MDFLFFEGLFLRFSRQFDVILRRKSHVFEGEKVLGRVYIRYLVLLYTRSYRKGSYLILWSPRFWKFEFFSFFLFFSFFFFFDFST